MMHMKSGKLHVVLLLAPLALASCVTTAPKTASSRSETATPSAAASSAHVDTSAWHFDARPKAEHDGYRPPLKLAVLLPLTGPLSTAAAPVRDGLLAGYYGETRAKPALEFIDTAGPGGIPAACSAATAAGADFVVGPLGRDQVGEFFASAECAALPSLALNRSDKPVPPGHASFSLAPEDDGSAAADYLSGLEKKNALIVSAGDDGNLRAAKAFRERFIADGGNIVQTLAVVENPGDLATSLAPLAGKGIDGIFLAVRGNTARLLAPQLAIAGLGGATRTASSQLLIGTGKASDDSALDGIVFPTDAWSARGVPGLPPPSVAGANLPTARGVAARLFAFGFDAWRLSAYADKLAQVPGASIDGATGTLKLDAAGNVQRTPAWSMFSGGVPVALNAR